MHIKKVISEQKINIRGLTKQNITVIEGIVKTFPNEIIKESLLPQGIHSKI